MYSIRDLKPTRKTRLKKNFTSEGKRVFSLKKKRIIKASMCINVLMHICKYRQHKAVIKIILESKILS